MKSLNHLILILTLVLLSSSCRPPENKTVDDWTTATFSLNSISQSKVGPLFSQSGNNTVLISVVPVDYTLENNQSIPAEYFDRNLLNLKDYTVSLAVPLGRPLRLVQNVYSVIRTLDSITNNVTASSSFGISDSFEVYHTAEKITVQIDLINGPAITAIIPADGSTDTPTDTGISVSFNNKMETSSITVNTIDTACTGTILVSKDDFSSCLKMASDPQVGINSQTFMITPAFALDEGTTYKTRILGSVTDEVGNYLEDDYTTPSGFLTASAELSLTAAVSTISGTVGTPGSADGTGTAASFNSPASMATDGVSLYLNDNSNHTIRKIVISTVEVTTLAGTAGVAGFLDGTGIAATFTNPSHIITDGINLFVTDWSHTIRKVVITTGVVSTLAGSGGISGSTDATGAVARFNVPNGIATDGTNLYVAEEDNHTIRKIVISTGDVTTFAGTTGTSGTLDGTGIAARFNRPEGIIKVGPNLYVADKDNHTIRKIVISTGEVTTFAGTASTSGSADGTGTAARFNWPVGITTDSVNLYVTDFLNHTIRKIVISTGEVTTLAGTAGLSGFTDGTGISARFDMPAGITTDGTRLYISDLGNHTIRKIE